MSKIEISNVSKRFGDVTAVADLSLVVNPGEFVTLLGPSGSGKTTTMRMIAGLERPTAGVISIGDRVVSAPSVFVPTHRRSLGMVFQSYAVWPHKTVFENVAFPLSQRGVGRGDQKRLVMDMLSRVELADYSKRYPAELSGGQQQRVALARALVGNPDVILFDEPLSNLDAQLRDTMRILLAELHQELGVTSVYVTHDQSEAMVLSDRVYIMDQGRLIQEGPPADIYERPNTLFVAGFIGKANTIKLAEIDRARSIVRLESGEVLRVSSIVDDPKEQTLVVRPHQLSFASNGETENVLEGTIRSASYLGDRTRYVVKTNCTAELAIELVAGTAADWSVGEPVRVRLLPQYCRVI